MSLSPQGIAALREAVSNWRMQEYIALSLFTLYLSKVYYYATTVDEEVGWFRRFLSELTTAHEFLDLLHCTEKVAPWESVVRDDAIRSAVAYSAGGDKTYFVITPSGCKALLAMSEASYKLVIVATDASLGLCLCALLGARSSLFSVIMLICTGYPIVGMIFAVAGDIQLPSEPITPLDQELGYPCYLPEPSGFSGTLRGLGIDVRQYVNFAFTILLLALAIATLVIRYRHHNGRLIQVIRRDGVLYYFTVTAIRFAIALMYTPSVIPAEERESSPAIVFALGFQDTCVPILAQRLLLNLRKVEYPGTRPIASALLFAPYQRDGSSPTADSDAYEMTERLEPNCKDWE
ncbi:hypothetical protein NMY22_g15201 [Coprinellus aureogranulatus]|nr:hypothetical protein NMY22_g15201 [Coprinellus aureogranulatus]